VLNPAGAVGAAERTILVDSLAIMLAIVVPVIVATFAFAFWYRASNTRAVYQPDWVHSGRIELVVWAIPILVVSLLGGVTWIGSHRLDPSTPIASSAAPVNVQVVSLDWKWLFIYPDQHIAIVNRLVIPAGVPIHFSITSASVLNAFFIPQLGSMIYAMNGMATQLNLVADQPATLQGRSTMFSGDGFPDMHFEVQALPQDGFNAWVADTSKDGPTLDDHHYEALAKRSLGAPVSTFSQIDPNLFQRIVEQKLSPGPGPQGALPASSVASPQTEPSHVR
jgi:cytochrome o ubiquinol oxidase subunit 2